MTSVARAGAAEQDGAGSQQQASHCGYYDQAHMTGAFRQFTDHSLAADKALRLPHSAGVVGD